MPAARLVQRTGKLSTATRQGEEERASDRIDGAGIEPASPRERLAMWNDHQVCGCRSLCSATSTDVEHAAVAAPATGAPATEPTPERLARSMETTNRALP
ncbi:hypothetical protein GALMADRAFT_139359 [Galerina marginata CBS 339.88]|uniref:Uncharacterized protein n=1 Tax=Galerina marginata (strain CBS 339.88) TaxID=685588 RepID=A0A067T2L9_GALM3|nr:hypothetical protein GALMADRAFT_139359 [Galerina marginata CBS 339.88]